MAEHSIQREHERFAFLDERSHDHVANYLAEHGADLGQDDKTSYFFVLPDTNLSVAQTDARSVIKFKAGQIGRGIGFEELPEIVLASPDQADNAVRLFRALTGLEPQVSQQFRHNYALDDVELALKYTQTWGFHLEFECLYSVESEEELDSASQSADEKISRVAGLLGVSLAEDQELIDFNTHFKETGEHRGEYTADEIQLLYSSLYKMAATRRLPKQQHMDALTLDWIQNNRPELPHDMKPIRLSDEENTVLADLTMPESWFPASGRRESLHGQLHLARVGTYASTMARKLGRSDAEARSLFVAGLLHDISRTHDQDDPEHARRSAEWSRNHVQEMSDRLGGVAEGIDTELVYEAIRAHDGEVDDIDPKFNWAADCLRAADALDRYRLPKLKWWINDSYLSLVPDDTMKAQAFSVVVMTEETLLKTGDVAAATARIINPNNRT